MEWSEGNGPEGWQTHRHQADQPSTGQVLVAVPWCRVDTTTRAQGASSVSLDANAHFHEVLSRIVREARGLRDAGQLRDPVSRIEVLLLENQLKALEAALAADSASFEAASVERLAAVRAWATAVSAASAEARSHSRRLRKRIFRVRVINGSGGDPETDPQEHRQPSRNELETTNEELQSTVEELETTNEELQSSNSELRERTDEVERVNEFMESILRSVQLGVVVVDSRSRVKMWHGRSHELWGLDAAEVYERSIRKLDFGLPLDEIEPAIARSLSEPDRVERLVVTATNRRGRRIQVRILATGLPIDREDRGVILLMEELKEEGAPGPVG
jgi:PAS domain S-box-containing protein